eukprot:gene38566-46878_t
MLQYGVDSAIFSQQQDGIKSLVETVLRILLQYPCYHSCLILLKLLIDKFAVTAHLIFDIGCSLSDELADIINDDNFIALLHFAAHYSAGVDADTLLKMVKFLALTSGHIVGEFKSNFFVSKCTNLFRLGLQGHYCREGSSRSEQEITWYTLRMLRIIASVHPISNKDLGHSGVLNDVLALLRKHGEINEKILREILALINTLSGNNLEGELVYDDQKMQYIVSE